MRPRADGPVWPLLTVRLTQDSDGCWTLEPLGLEGMAGYRPERVGPAGPRVSGCDVAELVCGTARDVVAAALGIDRYGFELRFVSEGGVQVARSVLRRRPWGPQGQLALHELILVSPWLRERAT